MNLVGPACRSAWTRGSASLPGSWSQCAAKRIRGCSGNLWSVLLLSLAVGLGIAQDSPAANQTGRALAAPIRTGQLFQIASSPLDAPMAAGIRAASPDGGGPHNRPHVVPGQLLVKFRSKVAADRKAAALDSVAAEVKHFQKPSFVRRGAVNPPSSSEPGSIFEQLALVKLSSNLDLDSAIAQVQKSPDVLYAEPNFIYRIAAAAPIQSVPDDFDVSKIWGLHNTGQNGGTNGADIRAFEAWTLGTGDRRVLVAVLDTGVDYFHPDLAANIWTNSRELPGNGLDDDNNGYIDDVHGYDFVSNDSDPMDDNNHGTHVSGIIGAVGNNKLGIAGVCWQVSLMSVKAFDDAGNADAVQVVEAIHYAINNGAQIINASWGSSDRSRALEEVVSEASRAGIVFVAAAGNEKTDALFYPAAYHDVLAVGATDSKDQRALFSNSGSYVDVAAPGDNIYSTLPNNHFDFISGTSMAAPHVAGLAALIKARHSEFTNRDIESIIRNTTDALITDKYIGSGRINAYRAMLVDSPLPIAILTVPAVVNGSVQITGSARGNNFAGYSLEYGKGTNPTNWTQFYASTASVTDGRLLDGLITSALDEGAYTIRLISKNATGQPATDRAFIEVRNVSITFPSNNDLLRAGEAINIHGTVFGPNRTYTLEYGVGSQPKMWFTNGVTLLNGGQQEVLDSTLATWDTRQVKTNEFYALKLTARVAEKIVGEQFVHMIYLDGRLKAGWPQYVPIVGEYPPEDWRDVKVADIDHDGFDELLLVDHGNSDGRKARLLVYNYDGHLRWSKELAAGVPYSDIPVVGDVDNDGFMEIFADVGERGELFAFRHDGSSLPGNWPIRLEATNLGKVLADLDGDGFKELVACAQNPKDGSETRLLFVLNKDGTILRKWSFKSCPSTIDVPKLFPAVGNLDGEPDLEIVAVSGCNQLSVYKFNQPNGPLWTAKTEGTLLASPVMGDLNHDGTNEVVIAAHKSPGLSQGGLYAFSNSGHLWPGWPVLVEESFSAAPALADFDKDGDLEISIPSAESQKLFLVHHNGFSAQGWPVGPVEGSYVKSSTVIGDVNSDGKLDVVMASPGWGFLTAVSGDLSVVGGIKAWDFVGRLIDLNSHGSISALVMEASGGKSWLKAAPITLADIDHDGKLDIIASSIQDRAFAPLEQPSPRKNRSSLYVWELDVPFDPENMPWPTFQGSSEHTGLYKPPPHKNLPPVVSDLPDQTIRSGASFFSVELDQYVEDPDHQPKEMGWRVVGNNQLKVSIDPNHVVTIVPPEANWIGQETVQFVATDPGGLSSSDLVVLEVRANYDPPVAREDAVITAEDTPLEIDPLANDTDPDGDPLTILRVSKPRFGTVRKDPQGRLTYTPAADFSGADRFTYTIGDGKGCVAISLVRIEVTAINDSPLALADRVITLEDTPVRIHVLANDRDPDGDLISLVEFTQPANGSVITQAGGALLYSPNENFFGLDSFGYTIRDANKTEGASTVTVMVKPVNDLPVAKDQTFSMNKRSSLNLEFLAQDSEGDSLTFTVVQSPEHGVLLAYPTVAGYSPKKEFVGTDSFTYKANDGQADSELATVFFTVLDANNPPVVEYQSLITKQGQALQITLAANDADDDALTFQIVSQSQKGSLSVDGAMVSYRPNPGFIGFDEFKFKASDGRSISETGTISIQVTDLNTAPVAKDSLVIAKMNRATNFVLQVSDGEANPLSYSILTNPVNGTLTGTAPDLIYTPQANYTGADRFTFKANDGEFDSEAATVTIAVRFPNNAPEPKEQSISIAINQASAIALNVIDRDGDPLLSAILKGPINGRLTGRGTNFIYSPKIGFIGTDTFTYKVWDGHTYSPVGKVTVSVTSPSSETRLAIDSIERLSNGQTRIRLRTQPGKTFSLQASTNLADWTPLISLTADGPTTSFVDPDAPSFSGRFYRAVQP